MKMEKINEKDVDGIGKMLNGGGGTGVNIKTMLKPTTKSSSSGTMINGTIHEELEAHMNPCNYLMVDELGVAGNPVMPPDSSGGEGGPFAIKQKLQTGSAQNGTGNLIQIPIPMHHRSSRSIRSLKRPQPQPHICIVDKTVDHLDVYINVLSWTRIVKPEKTNDPIPLYGGMRVISGSTTYKPLLIYAVTVNPIVLENTKRLNGNTTAQQSLMTLMVDFVEAMNPDLKLKRQPKILLDRDLTGELKEIWLALHSKRERDKFRVLEESYYLYEEFGPPAPVTTSPTSTNECDERAEDDEIVDGQNVLDNCTQSDCNVTSSSNSSQDKIDSKGIISNSSNTSSSVPFTKKPTTIKGTDCVNKTHTTSEKKSPVTESTTTSTALKGSASSSSSSGGKIKSPSDDTTPSPQITVIQNTKNRTSHIPILGIKDNKDHNKDNKENKEKEKKDKSGGDQSPIQRSIDFLAGISFFKSKNHENGANGGSNGAATSGNSINTNNNSADSNNHKSNGGNSKKKDKNNSNSSSSSNSSNSKQQTSSKQQQGVRNSNNVSNDSSNSNTGRNDKINNSIISSSSNSDGGE